MRQQGQVQVSELKEAILAQRSTFRRATWISLIAGLLSLMPTLYMLEVYDRVVNSRSLITLQMLLLLAIGVYVVMEVLDWARAEMMRRAGEAFDARVRERLFDATFMAHLGELKLSGYQVFGDLRTLREFFASPALLALMESPIAIVFLLLIFWIDPTLGWFAVIGATVQLVLALLTERRVLPPLKAATTAAIQAQMYAGGVVRNAEIIEAMGMQDGIRKQWQKMQHKHLQLQALASDHAGSLTAMAKSVQLIQGSALLGLGCWLTVQGTLAGGGGMMIVASILGGMVLKPLVQAVSNWQLVVSGRDAYQRLDRLLTLVQPPPVRMPLPVPQGHLSVEAMTAGAPGGGERPSAPILRNVSFTLKAGECLAVVGPSASGKSTLARLLTGVWPAQAGRVRLDGADIFTWDKAELGPFLGYLPQEIELFDGTLGENIARFGPVAPDKLHAAGSLAGLELLIAELPQGYDTPIGEDGAFLSGGQRQRVGLARAIYGDPHLVVLDEPNASLDEAGSAALVTLLRTLKSRGVTVVIMTHRRKILSVVDRMLVLFDGAVQTYGPRDEVLAAIDKARHDGDLQAPVARLDDPGQGRRT